MDRDAHDGPLSNGDSRSSLRGLGHHHHGPTEPEILLPSPRALRRNAKRPSASRQRASRS